MVRGCNEPVCGNESIFGHGRTGYAAGGLVDLPVFRLPLQARSHPVPVAFRGSSFGAGFGTGPSASNHLICHDSMGRRCKTTPRAIDGNVVLFLASNRASAYRIEHYSRFLLVA